MKLFCLENKSVKYRFSAEYLSANFEIIANSLNDKYDLLRWRGKEVFVNLLTGARAKEVRKRKKERRSCYGMFMNKSGQTEPQGILGIIIFGINGGKSSLDWPSLLALWHYRFFARSKV